MLIVSFCVGASSVCAASEHNDFSLIADALQAVCDVVKEEDSPALSNATLDSTTAIVMRGSNVGTRYLFSLNEKTSVRVDRFAPGGRLRRISAEMSERSEYGVRPTLFAMASPSCRMVQMRQLHYQGEEAIRIDVLGPPDGQLLTSEVLNPEVPRGPGTATAASEHAVRVAVVDSGVNYTLAEVAARLARDEDGEMLGYDFWDLDARPFDAHPSASPFFPQRHGTQTASVILSEAPIALLLPFRYPRTDMTRMTALIQRASERNVVIVNMSLGSTRSEDWREFAKAAAAHPDMLFITSAGNDGKNIDVDPVYPASLELENVLTVTSANVDATLARGSNWGPRSVDLMVPAEGVLGFDFDGRSKRLSGASYAASRVSALAACLLAKNSQWRASELKAAILSRTQSPDATLKSQVGSGFLPDPTQSRRGDCVPEPTGVEVLSKTRWSAAAILRQDEAAPPATHALKIDLVNAKSSGWSALDVLTATRQAGAILRQCGVRLESAELHTLRVPRRYLHIDEMSANGFATSINVGRPSVFFVRDSLPGLDFEAFAYSLSNSRHLTGLRFTAWLTRGLRDPGISLAHEIVHILINGGAHDPDPANLMHAQTRGDNSALRDDQCERVLRVGTALGNLQVLK